MNTNRTHAITKSYLTRRLLINTALLLSLLLSPLACRVPTGSASEPTPAAPAAADAASATPTTVFLPMVATAKPSATPPPGGGNPTGENPTGLPDGPLGDGWPMAAGNPQRTSWTAEEVKGDLKPEWFQPFDAYISQRIQVVASGGLIYIAASDGLHALDAASGEPRWFYPTELPLGHSPTIFGGVAFVAGLDHRLYALNAATGDLLWSFLGGAGFVTSPVIDQNLVLLGGRDGVFYAIHADGEQAGTLAWQYATAGPILFSAAVTDGVAYFVSNDMYAYALRVTDGVPVWKSAKLPGSGFNSYWPVIYDRTVVLVGSYSYRYTEPFPAAHTDLERQGVFPNDVGKDTPIGPTGTAAGPWAPGTPTIRDDAAAQYFEQFPYRRTTFTLDRSTGQEVTYDSDNDGKAEYPPILWFGTHSGTRFPPIVGRDGVLYQTNALYYDDWILRGRIVGWQPNSQVISVPDGAAHAVDEPVGYATGGSTIYWKRCCDRMAGAFEIVAANGSGTNADIQSWNYFDEGGKMLRRSLPELFDRGWPYAYWKHGDASPPIPYRGRVYMIVNNALVAFSPNGHGPVVSDLPTRDWTGQPAKDLEKSQSYGALTTRLTLHPTSWPTLLQQETYYSTDSLPNARARYFPLMEVAAGSGSPSGVTADANAARTLLTSTIPGGVLTTRFSERTPTILFDTTASSYRLSGAFSGLAYPSAAGVRQLAPGSSLAGGDLAAGWLLVWDTRATHRFSPQVISLQRRPSSLTFTANALELTFSGAAGQLAVSDLNGMSAPRPDANWDNRLPGGIAERAALLDRMARAFPEAVREDMHVDDGSGDVTLTWSYTFAAMNNEWNQSPLNLALLPPKWALAAWDGSPIEIEGGYASLLDLDYVTPLGRLAGKANANSISLRLPGLAGLWRGPTPAPAAPAQNDPALRELIAEVRQMVAAGHLQPGYTVLGIWEAKAGYRLGDNLGDYWKNPADTTTTLLRLLPLLPADLQGQVRAYLQAEFAAYPLDSTAHVGWRDGASRTAFDLPPEVAAAAAKFGPNSNTTFNDWGLPPQNFYALWLYTREFGGAAELWNRSQGRFDHTPQFVNSFPYALNSYLAGYIGYLRLAQEAGVARPSADERTLVELLGMRAAALKYPAALAARGFEYGGYAWSLRRIAPATDDTLFEPAIIGSQWSQMALYGFPIDILYGMSGPATGGNYTASVDFMGLTPEVARFVRSYGLAEATALTENYAQRAPYWFVAHAPETGGEGSIQPLYDQAAFFQARAAILRQPRPQLELFLDAPAFPVGDLFHLQNLLTLLSPDS